MIRPRVRVCGDCGKWTERWCVLAAGWFVCPTCCPYKEHHQEHAR